MPGAPPLPERKDSLPCTTTPPIPPKPVNHQLSTGPANNQLSFSNHSLNLPASNHLSNLSASWTSAVPHLNNVAHSLPVNNLLGSISVCGTTTVNQFSNAHSLPLSNPLGNLSVSGTSTGNNTSGSHSLPVNLHSDINGQSYVTGSSLNHDSVLSGGASIGHQLSTCNFVSGLPVNYQQSSSSQCCNLCFNHRLSSTSVTGASAINFQLNQASNFPANQQQKATVSSSLPVNQQLTTAKTRTSSRLCNNSTASKQQLSSNDLSLYLPANRHNNSTSVSHIGVLPLDHQARLENNPSSLVPRSASAPGSYGHLKKMATLEHLNVDTSVSQDYEYKSHYKHCFKTFYDFYEKGQLCDIEIVVGEKTFKCHKMVLACVSQYFRAMFMSEMAECQQNKVTIHDIDESAMEKLIWFAYTSKIHFTVDTVQPILYAASILQIETVAKACCEFMKKHLHPTNCIGVHNFAEQHNRTELMKMADDYILEHYLEVVDTDEFKNVSFRLMKTLMASDDLNVMNEMQVFESLIKWVNADPDERKNDLAKLVSHLKLPLLSPTYLQKHVASDNLVKKDLECRDLLDEAKYYQMSVANLLSDIKISERTRPRKSYAGVLFCVGGRGASGDPFKSIECYDYRKNRWFQVSEMNIRRRHVGVCCTKDLLYAVGGHDGTKHLNSGEVFNPLDNTWKAITPMSTPRRGIALASLGGPIYAVGGLDDSTCFNTVERYDPISDTWTHVASMNTPRGGVGVAALKGHLYAVGGNDGVSSLDKCERYDPFVNRWSYVAVMNRHRAGAGVAVLDGYIYVVGGFDDNAPLDSCERYDPYTNEWKTVASMSCCRGGVGVGTLGGKLYAVGGHDGTNYLSSVEAYDPLTNSWKAMSDIRQCRAGAGLACSNVNVATLRDSVKQNKEQLHCV